MNEINRNKVFKIENYSFKNYTLLSRDWEKIVLSWRNHPENRKWMLNNNEISWNEHLKFIEDLKISSNRYYCLVIKDFEPIGSIDFVNIDYNEKTAEIGYFLAPEKQGSGLGLEFIFYAFKFAFDILGFNVIQGNVMDSNKIAYALNAFLGFKYLHQHIKVINGKRILFHYCEITKEDFFKNVETKNDINYFIQFYKNIQYGNS